MYQISKADEFFFSYYFKLRAMLKNPLGNINFNLDTQFKKKNLNHSLHNSHKLTILWQFFLKSTDFKLICRNQPKIKFPFSIMD